MISQANSRLVYTHRQSRRFLYRLKMGPMMLFTHNVKMIKGAAQENGDLDGTCEGTFVIHFKMHKIDT